MTAVTVARARDAAVAGRLVAVVRTAAPGLRRAVVRARSLVLHVGGLGAITAAAWLVALRLGLLVAGVSLLTLEYLAAEP
jgi:hypothetical protein